MNLKEVTLQNVRLFTNQKFSFKKGVNELSAPNRAGKTTLADAVSFLLTGKLYSGSADLASLKPANDTSKKVVVEAVFELSDGSELTLKKEYQENWVTTRGTSETRMDGHITNLFINGVKKIQKDFDKEIFAYFAIPDLPEVTGQEMIQGLTKAYFFSETLPWAKLRSIINKIIGVVEPKDVFLRAPKTQILQPRLASVAFKIAELRKLLLVELTGKKENARTFKAQIDGDIIASPVSEDEFTKSAQTVSSLERQILDLEVKRKGIVNPVVDKLKEDLQKTQEALTKSQQADNAEMAKKNSAVGEKIEGIRNERAELQRKATELELEINGKQREIRTHEATITTNGTLITTKKAQKSVKLDEYYKVEAEQYTPKESFMCPSCGFDLNEQLNTEGLQQFNTSKAERIKNIIAQGNALKAEIEKLEADNKTRWEKIAELNEEIKIKKESLDTLNTDLASIDDRIRQAGSERIYFFESDSTRSIKKSIETINQAIAEEGNRSNDTAMMDEQISGLKSAKAEAQATIDEYQAQKRIQSRRIEREKELVKVNSDIAGTTTTIDDLNEYTATWLEIVSERIRAKFGDVKIRLVKENIKEGSWDEVCEVMIDTPHGEVPYSTANTEVKIRTGVKLADRIAEHLGIEPLPMWVDDCEHITPSNRQFDTRSQLVLLVAAEKVDERKVENINYIDITRHQPQQPEGLAAKS
jgi:DNA repair exonuclease SbcCD ATPase subunit